MKHNLITFLAVFISIIFCLSACKEKTQISNRIENSIAPEQKIENAIHSEYKSSLRSGEKIKLGKIYRDTVNYLNFNEDYDYWLFIVEKNADTIALVYNDEQQSQFSVGEQIVIHWKMDSIRQAGDSEFLDFTTFLVSSEQIEND